MNMNHPVYKGWSDCFIYFLLPTHVCRVRVPVFFCVKHILLNLLAKFCHMINIVHWSSICFTYMIENLVFATLMEHLQFLMKADSRKFFSWWGSVSWTCSFHISWRFAPLCSRTTRSRFSVTRSNSAYSANSWSKGWRWNDSSLRWSDNSLLRGCRIFLNHWATFSNKRRFSMPKLISWSWRTINFSAT